MADKPSLYVVEKKEVIILVVLFVIVTVLSFTLGVRYGESVGKKAATELQVAAKEHGEGNSEASGGTLGKTGHSEEAATKHDEHAAPAKTEHGASDGHAPAKDAGKGAKEGEHGAPADAHHAESAAPSEHASHSPEAAAKATPRASGTAGSHEAVDKNSDEYLLNALKNAGVEPPGGKAPKDAKLPNEVKESKRPASRVHAGSYVIQVGSHPTRSEAESQLRQLKARKIQAEILPPFKDRQGEWHRVVLGSYKSKRDAEREASGLKGKGSIVSFFVWRLP